MQISSTAWQEAPAAAPSGRTLIAIGDVHGHASQLEAMHRFMADHVARTYDPNEVTIVWLGDYVDRGREPGTCLDLVFEGLGVEGVREIRLRGNHDQFLLDALEHEAFTNEDLSLWIINGGGVTIEALLGDKAWSTVRELSAALSESLGEERIAALKRLQLTHQEGPYLFVHAGIEPDLPLNEQGADTFLWIRQPFLSGAGWSHNGTVVVHGHTPSPPIALRHRIGIDSGVYMTSTLTAVEIHGQKLRFISATENGELPMEYV